MICPIAWLEVANRRASKYSSVTDWLDGTVAPVRVGFYERHFTDSTGTDSWSVQYWDGAVWRATPNSKPHWRQVGDYPAWRGLAGPAPKQEGASE